MYNTTIQMHVVIARKMKIMKLQNMEFC